MSGDKATLDFYDGEAPVYAPWSAPKSPLPWLEKFLSLAPETGRLLDYGCGGGWAAKRMLEAGYEVDAFDGSAGLAKEAAALTGLDVKVHRFEDFDAQDRYDGIWASFCLLHVPCAEMPANLARIYAALRPGGVFYLGLKAGSGEKRDKLGRFYSYFEPEVITRLLRDAGFDEPQVRLRDGDGYDGEPEKTMHIFTAR